MNRNDPLTPSQDRPWRVWKEQANAERGISPKRERSGFLLLRASDYTKPYHPKGVNAILLQGGQHVTLQTWFKGEHFNRSDVDSVWQHTMPEVAELLGLDFITNEDLSLSYSPGFYGSAEKSWDRVSLYGYGAKFIYDGRSGYWNVEFYTTRPITTYRYML